MGRVMPYARLPYVLALVPVIAACSDDGGSPSDRSASMAGRVAIAGQSSAVAGASIAVDQIRVDDASGAVREHIGDTTSDAEGRFQLDGFGERNGLFLVTSSGGSFRDLVSAQTVELDPSDQIRTLITLDLFEERTDALVSGVGHLTEVLARQRLAEGLHPDLYEAREFAATHIDAHFGGVTWQRIDPARLDTSATSATDPVRAALVAEAWAILSNGIATAAGASPQEVNVYSLMEAWSTDLAAPPFDGQDNNNNAHGSGVQLGECPAVPDGCIPSPPAPACSLGSCRTECDLYSGTPRAALSGALLKLVRSNYNQTGLADTAILPLARAMAENTDDVLFSGCVDNLDRTAPSIFFEAPTPSDGAFVRGTISVRVRAVDDIDTDPDLVFLSGLVDGDGDDSNAVATAEVSAAADGPLTVEAKATDAAGNSASTSRAFNFDNTDPVITLAPTGFYVQGTDWWTGIPTPVIGGMITEANLDVVNVYAGTTLVGVATVTGSSWSFTLASGVVPGLAGVDVRIEARDRAGGTASVTQRIRYDAAPPVVTVPVSSVRNETGDSVNFARSIEPLTGDVTHIQITHRHQGAVVPLGASTTCDTTGLTSELTKYIHLLDESPPSYVTEESETPGGETRNPIRWQFVATDDGVGVDFSTVQYRIRDVAAGTFPLNWTHIAGTGSYSIPLYRRGTMAPSIPALGTKEGLLEIQFQGFDRLGRLFEEKRCWQHKLLAPPILVGPFDTMGRPAACGSGTQSCAPTNGPAGSGKYGLNRLALGDVTAPIDPIAAEVLQDSAAGTGLMQYQVWNASTEPIYLSVDLTNPAVPGAEPKYTKSGVENRWGYTQSSDNASCGNDGDGGPDESRPGCNYVGYPAMPDGMPFSVTTPADASVVFGLRVWEEVSSTNFTELVPCAGCSMTPMGGDHRITVVLPARPAPGPGGPAFPRKFWVVPVVKVIDELRPNGVQPYSEFSIGGATLTGKIEETRSGCWDYEPSGANFTCVARRTYRRYRALTQVSFTLSRDVITAVKTSWDGTSVRPPPHLADNVRQDLFSQWTTTEAALPPIPPAL